MTIDLWTESRGPRGFTVWVGERADRGLAVYLRWRERGRVRWQRAEVQSVRDARGRLLRRAVEAAQREADNKAAELQGQRPARSGGGPLTLGMGVRLAFSDRGPYPLDPAADTYTQAARKAADDAVRLLGGEDVEWESVTPGMIRGIWRKTAREYAKSTASGANVAEKRVGIVYRISTWLQGEYPEHRFPAPIKGWRGELKEHWAKARGERPAPHQPRYSPEEVQKLFAAAFGPKADPRMRLAIVLGAELRGGQVIRAMRSDFDPDAGEHGRVEIPFRSTRKTAPPLLLNSAERRVLDEAMAPGGLLHGLETAYQAGELEDYPLFPGGEMREGVAPLPTTHRMAGAPMDRSTLQRLLRDLEELAKVPYIKGRGWHGLRRALTDLYPEHTADARLLDLLGGWARGSTMRETIYQRKDDEETARRAAELRARVRGINGTEGEG